jgi:hypothetical protein
MTISSLLPELWFKDEDATLRLPWTGDLVAFACLRCVLSGLLQFFGAGRTAVQTTRVVQRIMW